MYSTRAFAKREQNGRYEIINIGRGWTSEDDVDIEIHFCGLSPFADVHLANYDWGSVPGLCAVVGHEISGVVCKVGSNVNDVFIGDHVGVGYFIDSCLDCKFCHDGQENNCIKGVTKTSCGFIKHGRVKNDNGRFSYGGRSEKITVNRRFVSTINKDYPLEKAAPVFCAGVTMFTPLKEFGAANGGLNVGVMGLGGLGQFGVMLAKAMGNKVTVISTSNTKKDLANRMGADVFVNSKNPEDLQHAEKTLDILLDTVGADHQLPLGLLKKKGTLVVLGIVSQPFEVDSATLIQDQIRITGSDTGGNKMNQECINFMVKHSLQPETRIISSLEELEEAETKLRERGGSSLKFRYVLDIKRILST